MNPMNFPKRKLLRKMRAEGVDYNSEKSKIELQQARDTRTKIKRGV